LPLGQSCPVGALALLFPGRAPVVLGPTANAHTGTSHLNSLRYPADGSVVGTGEATFDESDCTAHGPAHARSQLRSLSLFAGTVTAASITLTLGPTAAATIVGLKVGNQPVSAAAGTRTPLGTWGYVLTGPQELRLATGAGAVSALTIQLLHPHAGLPSGTTILVTFAGLPIQPPATRTVERTSKTKNRRARPRHTHTRAQADEPLKGTPPLGQRHFTFPVVGVSDYIDTYGAFRSDVPGNWHHGDDIFAALGTPVVAVASGTINRVGWERLGGWRL
jgi:hypothetical protein